MEEMSIGVACVGAAVLTGSGVVGAMSVSAPRARMTDARIEDVGQRIVALAAEVSQRLAPADEISRSATNPR